MSWMNSSVSPSRALACTASTSSREPGDEAIVADAQQRPRRDVADAGRLDDDARPARPSAKRPYQSSTSRVTKPSSVARHGTIAGTQVRCARLERRRCAPG